MDLFSINSANELRLRKHIREVLLPYARTHLTSDHVAFTEKAVEELLLQTLEYAPMADATLFQLPTEPLEVLIHSLDSLDLTLPEERWAAPSGHVRYLRTFFPPPVNPQDLQTGKCWHEDDHYAKLSLICKPMTSPVLSKRAKRETPALGGSNYSASIPRTNATLSAFLGFSTLSTQGLEDLPIPPIDDVLDLRLKLDSAGATRAFLQSILVPSSAGRLADCVEGTPNVPEFLRHESLPRCLSNLDSPPLFPRVLYAHSTRVGVKGNTNNGMSNVTRIPSLVSMLQAASPELIDGEDGDINGHHMEVVSGWTTLKFSSPPPLSPHSSDGSEVDELWNISPPGTPATSLIATRMDEVEIPRTRKFGHKSTLSGDSTNHTDNADLLTVAKSPGFFITSFISAPIPMVQSHKPVTSRLEGVKSGMHSPHPLSPVQHTSNPLHGKHLSLTEDKASDETSAGLVDFAEVNEEQQFDDAIARIYVSTPQDPLSYIREEKLDDKDIMLMDVPDMPPPTANSKERSLLPEGMRTFVTPTGELSRIGTPCDGNNALCPVAFLRPAKGIKPLTLDLSWRPFNFGKTIPTDEEVAGVAKSILPEDETPGHFNGKYEQATRVLLDLGAVPTRSEEAQPTPTLSPNTPRGCKKFGTSPTPNRAVESGQMGYLLTHQERLRASGAKIMPDPEAVVLLSSHNDGHDKILSQEESPYQHGERQGLHNSPDCMQDFVQYCHGSHYHTSNDSGIDIIDNITDQFSTGGLTAPSLLESLRGDSLCAVDTLEADGNNRCENKENIPPRDTDDCQLNSLQKPYSWGDYFEFPESETTPFEPLPSVSSNQPLEPLDNPANSKVQDILSTPSCRGVKRAEDLLTSISEQEQTNPSPRAVKRRKLNDLVPASSKDLFSTFIGLRNQGTLNHTIEPPETRNDTPTPHQTPDIREQIPPRGVPDDVFDRHTVRLPEHWIPATTVHRYLVSMALIQKRALICELQGPNCRIVLVERCDLGGADIIVDSDHGVLFIPLLALPANIESAVERISGESWRYLGLIVILEAFPSAQSCRSDHSQVTRPTPYGYTPPICKAIKKLRRILGIGEGCGSMNPGCTVTWAFANDVKEAAKFVRCFGEEARTISTGRGKGLLWDEREWLEEEEEEGELDLARVQGMNAFAAFVMLYNRPFETILELSPEARLTEFGPLLGQERMIGLNAVIESRLRQIAPDTEDSVVDPEY